MFLMWKFEYLAFSLFLLSIASASSGPTKENAKTNQPIPRNEAEQKQIKESCPPYGVYSKHRQ